MLLLIGGAACATVAQRPERWPAPVGVGAAARLLEASAEAAAMTGERAGD